MSNNLLNIETLKPLKYFGLKHSFFEINKDTFIASSFILACIILISLIVNYFMKKQDTNNIKYFSLLIVQSFKELLEQTLGAAPLNHLSFIGSLFIFILMSNTVSIIPIFEEPTKDLNTTLALSLIAFFYIQIYSMYFNGIKNYIKAFFEPFILMFPLNFIGTFTMIISLSFRLFGNIFGGFIISSLYYQFIHYSVLTEFIGIFSCFNLLITLFFGLFEGIMQAFVFSMLTLTYLSIETTTE